MASRGLFLEPSSTKHRLSFRCPMTIICNPDKSRAPWGSASPQRTRQSLPCNYQGTLREHSSASNPAVIAIALDTPFLSSLFSNTVAGLTEPPRPGSAPRFPVSALTQASATPACSGTAAPGPHSLRSPLSSLTREPQFSRTLPLSGGFLMNSTNEQPFYK